MWRAEARSGEGAKRTEVARIELELKGEHVLESAPCSMVELSSLAAANDPLEPETIDDPIATGAE